MNLIFILQISLGFLLPVKTHEAGTYQINSVCEKFAAGKIDALKTLEALDLKIDDYSIGLNNTAKIFCT